jgi:hypothetical protein
MSPKEILIDEYEDFAVAKELAYAAKYKQEGLQDKYEAMTRLQIGAEDLDTKLDPSQLKDTAKLSSADIASILTADFAQKPVSDLETLHRIATGRIFNVTEQMTQDTMAMTLSLSEYKRLLTQAIVSRRPPNRAARLAFLSKRRIKLKVAKKAEDRSIYKEAVRTGQSVTEVYSRRLWDAQNAAAISYGMTEAAETV